MAETNLTIEGLRAIAAEAGLERLSEEHLGQLLRATVVARARSKQLRTERLVYADEPAHVYRLDGGVPR
jgi:hypothetical protein